VRRGGIGDVKYIAILLFYFSSMTYRDAWRMSDDARWYLRAILVIVSAAVIGVAVMWEADRALRHVPFVAGLVHIAVLAVWFWILKRYDPKQRPQ
jgi:undecaprenyl pyrophosphate phosphatase UppP